ncbi:MAG: lytic transglycosylase domain-containing protein, partial [Pseudomonadota bacterium]
MPRPDGSSFGSGGAARRFRLSACASALALAAFWAPSQATARDKPEFDARTAALCDHAIAGAAARHGAPERLMRALSHVESGRRIEGERRAWPWTVNAGGDGRWFASKAEALAFANAKRAAGVRSIDLGCMQINLIWHGAAFSGMAEMLDPAANADYAARFLSDLKAETGDWMRAAGYYHSRTERHFNRYSRLVRTAYGALDGFTPAPLTALRRLGAAAEAYLPRRRAPQRPAPKPALWTGLLRQSRGDLLDAPRAAARASHAAARPDASAPRLAPTPAAAPARPNAQAVGAGGVALTFGRSDGGGGRREARRRGVGPCRRVGGARR